MSAYTIAFISLIVFLGTFIGVGVHDWLIDLEFERVIETHFEFADRASDAETKSLYFDQFVEAIEKHGLTEGANSKLFKDQPNADLTRNYNIAISLQNRLHDLAEMDPLSEEYQYGLRQLTLQEFCWFPINAFQQGYSLNNGGILRPLVPQDNYDRCHTAD